MKQQIPLVKVRFLDNFTDPANPREMFRPGIMRQAVITNEKLIQNICNHSGQKEAQVIAVLAALPDAVKDYATAGHSVQIDNLCTIRPVIHCKAVDTPEECNAQTIKSVSVSVLPIGKSAALYKKWGFRMVGDVVTGSANGDDGGVDEPNNGGLTSEEEGEKMTVYFYHHDNTVDEQQYAVGTVLTAANVPAADAGYAWPFLPLTVPEVSTGSFNLTEMAEADIPSDGKVTIKWVKSDSTEIERKFSVGDTVTAPDPESGYKWITSIKGPVLPKHNGNRISAIATA